MDPEKEKEKEQGLNWTELETPNRVSWERKKEWNVSLTSLCFHKPCFDDFFDMLREQQ